MLDVTGCLQKMYSALANNSVIYNLNIDNQLYNINAYINNNIINIEYLGEILCINCNKKTKTSFNQGYCFQCFRTLASCDRCIMSPELCHYHLGTCREPEWADQHCMQDHVVYLANSSGLKVGLTRLSQLPTRWIDQGATQAVIIARLENRYQAGLLEVMCKRYIKDRTDWRAMLKNKPEGIDLHKARDDLYEKIAPEFIKFKEQHSIGNRENKLTWCVGEQGEPVQEIEYPVQTYPDKVTSISLEKIAKVTGKLQGIKGQYLILDTGVINLRKYTGYKVRVSVTAA